jgi:hypothetical protein
MTHAVSEMLVNKSLFTAYECDMCDGDFGKGIEQDLGNWSKPMRTMAWIRGKSGVPTSTRSTHQLASCRSEAGVSLRRAEMPSNNENRGDGRAHGREGRQAVLRKALHKDAVSDV